MATVKQIRRRIRSVQSTKQITKAMEMVAASKLRRAQAQAEAARPYAKAMELVLTNLTGAARDFSHPLFEDREVRRVMVVVVTSDKGLCGSFNANLLRAAEDRIVELGLGRDGVQLVPVGKKAWQYFRRRQWDFPLSIQKLGDKLDMEIVNRLSRDATRAFIDKQVDRVEFVSTRFITTAKRTVETAALIPVVPAGGDEGQADYIFEPNAELIFGQILPRYITTRVLSAVADSLASEHSARMLSMGNATRNAEDMIASLTLTANKLRQAAITGELLEIVGGAAALE